MNEIENPNQQSTSEQPSQLNPKAGLIIAALLAGIIGGLFGSLYLADKPFFRKVFQTQGQSDSRINQSVVLDEQSATTEVVKKSGPAVVSVIVSKEIRPAPRLFFDPFGIFGNQNQDQVPGGLKEVGAGTGFLVSSDGLIVTNKHVVSDEKAEYSVVMSDDKTIPAIVLSRDPINDIALIKIEITGAPFLEFADSSKIELGQHVIAIGNSLGQYQNTVTAGIVSGIGRSITAGGAGELEQLDGVIQTDAAINSGNSGGPLLDLSGRVLGINTAMDRQGQSIGFAIPSNDVKLALESYQKEGRIIRPFLGVRYMMISEAIAKAENLPRDFGALLIRGNSISDFAVLPGSPADKAGLSENDIILEVNGEKLSEQNSLARILKKYKPDDLLSLKIYSKNQERDVKIIVGETK